MGLYEDDGEFINDLIAFDTSQIQRRCYGIIYGDGCL